MADVMDRYARGALTGAEARELAQASLRDPNLFEELTASALVQSALVSPSIRKHLEQPAQAKLVQLPRKPGFWIGIAAAAAVILFVAIYSLPGRQAWYSNPSQQTRFASPLKPALPPYAKAGQPVLLASDLQFEPIQREHEPVFRGSEPDSRSPHQVGSVAFIEDGLIWIDLGSSDGIARGSELTILRAGRPVGRLRISSVFRERARGQIVSGQKIQVHDRVRVSDAVHFRALLEQVDALSARGDLDRARKLAEETVQWVGSSNLAPGEKRDALERLAALEYQAGSLAAAEKHYQSVIDNLEAKPPASTHEQSVALNNLAVLRLLRGSDDDAETLLSRAISLSRKPGIEYGRSANNLGVLAEVRHNQQKAASFYTEALHTLDGIPAAARERQVVEANLARLRSSH